MKRIKVERVERDFDQEERIKVESVVWKLYKERRWKVFPNKEQKLSKMMLMKI